VWRANRLAAIPKIVVQPIPVSYYAEVRKGGQKNPVVIQGDCKDGACSLDRVHSAPLGRKTLNGPFSQDGASLVLGYVQTVPSGRMASWRFRAATAPHGPVLARRGDHQPWDAGFCGAGQFRFSGPSRFFSTIEVSTSEVEVVP